MLQISHFILGHPVAAAVIGAYVVCFMMIGYFMVFHSRVIDETDFEI